MLTRDKKEKYSELLKDGYEDIKKAAIESDKAIAKAKKLNMLNCFHQRIDGNRRDGKLYVVCCECGECHDIYAFNKMCKDSIKTKKSVVEKITTDPEILAELEQLATALGDNSSDDDTDVTTMSPPELKEYCSMMIFAAKLKLGRAIKCVERLKRVL